jgi:hypothetical protein
MSLVGFAVDEIDKDAKLGLDSEDDVHERHHLAFDSAFLADSLLSALLP